MAFLSRLRSGMIGRLLVGLVLSVAAHPVRAQMAEGPDPGLQYVQPHQMVDVGGRRLNLFCTGSGPHTVLFDSGGSDWSSTWALVHPEVAKGARACVYDRAGLGYSDPGRVPRTPFAIVEDMHQLIVAADLPRPLVLVGHSLGGFNVKLYAALYPEDVAGLVLIDPAEDRSAERVRAMTVSQFGPVVAARSELRERTILAFLLDRYGRCADLAREGDLVVGSDDYRRCTDPVRPALGPGIAAERQRLQARSTYQNAQASEILNSVFSDPEADVVYGALFRPGLLGDRPVIVLTHGLHDAADPLEAAGQAQSIALHQETARLSSRGRQSVVQGASHNIQIDAPAAIVESVESVLKALSNQASFRASS